VAAPAQVVRAQFEALEQGLDAVAAFWRPDVEWRAVEGAADDVGPIRGERALRAYYQDWIDTLDELRVEVSEILFEEGDRVAAAVRNSGVGRASGAPADGRYFVACVVRDGLIAAGREYSNAAQAIEAGQSGIPMATGSS
jgi:ketosteroid isomerase-like protein